jgi:hypothetical protein
VSERKAPGPNPRVEARRRFACLMAADGFDLVEAALLIAAEEYPDIDVRREASRVRILAGEAGRRAQGLANPFARLDVVHRWLYDDLGFRGNLHRKTTAASWSRARPGAPRSTTAACSTAPTSAA